MKHWAVVNRCLVSMQAAFGGRANREEACSGDSPEQASSESPDAFYLKADDEHTDGVADGDAAQVMCKSQFGVL